MYKLILTFLFLFAVITAFGQNGATFSGRIVDGETNQPLHFASVTLNLENEITSGTISGEDGLFSFSGISRGNYIVKCSFVGYQTLNTELLVGELNDIFDLGRIIISFFRTIG